MSLSVCIITRDNEDTIERCLKSVLPVADEICVVDTGSFDGTIDIVKKYAHKFGIHPWDHDFAAARNTSLELATCDWIMWMDSDDELTEESYESINVMKNEKLKAALYFTIENTGKYDHHYVTHETFQQLRAFPNEKRFRFYKRVHEQVIDTIDKAGYKLAKVPEIRILHHGYYDEKALEKKMFRNHRITLFETSFIPTDTHFYEFKIDEYFCFYSPNALFIFREMKLASQKNVEPNQTEESLDKIAREMILEHETTRFYAHGPLMINGLGSSENLFENDFQNLEKSINRISNLQFKG